VSEIVDSKFGLARLDSCLTPHPIVEVRVSQGLLLRAYEEKVAGRLAFTGKQ
jgi:hypothetical protein